MTRQHRAVKKWRAKMLAQNRCVRCGMPAVKSKDKRNKRGHSRYCGEHRLQHANYMRQYKSDKRARLKAIRRLEILDGQ